MRNMGGGVTPQSFKLISIELYLKVKIKQEKKNGGIYLSYLYEMADCLKQMVYRFDIHFK